MPLLEFVPSLVAVAEIRDPLVPLWAMEMVADLFLGAWLFFVGASVGSFLNVVVYRLPRGLNLVYPPSRCPSCLHSIRLRDNVPILSWLLLGGKCRDCRAAVSSRYFWIELLMGSLFLGVWLMDARLAQDFASPARLGWRALPAPTTVPFWCAYGLQVGLMATLVAGALIHADGFRTPTSLFAPVLIAGLALPVAWPEIRPVAAFAYHEPGDWQAGLIDGLAGMVAGAFVALCGSMRWLVSRRAWPRYAPVALLAAVGAVLGWQGMLLATPLIVLVYLAAAGALWLLGPLPNVPDGSPTASPLPEVAAEPDAPQSSHLDLPPAAAEPPLPAIPADRELTP